MRQSRTTPDDSSWRRGSIVVEFLLAFPTLLIATIALFEFFLMGLVAQAVQAVSLETAREAAKVGASPVQVEEVAAEMLRVHGLAASPATLDSSARGQVRVTVERPDGSWDLGNADIHVEPSALPLTAGLTRVTVSVRMTDVEGKRPIPNLLKSFGFDLGTRQFQIASTETIE